MKLIKRVFIPLALSFCILSSFVACDISDIVDLPPFLRQATALFLRPVRASLFPFRLQDLHRYGLEGGCRGRGVGGNARFRRKAALQFEALLRNA